MTKLIMKESILMNKLSHKEVNYALFGLALGDGSYRNGVIRVNHTNAQRGYVKLLEQFCVVNDLKHSTRYDYFQNTTFGRYEYSCISIWVPDRRHFENNRLIVDGVKFPTQYILSRISELGLLFWFLDDGCLSIHRKNQNKVSRFATLSTHAFGYFGNVQIKKMLKDRFDINAKINKDRQYYKIYMSATEFRKFYDVVRPHLDYVPECLKYKFNMQYTPNRLKDSVFNSLFYNLS